MPAQIAPPSSDLLTREQLRKVLHVSMDAVDRMISRGCPHYRCGRRYLFSMPEVLDFMRVETGRPK